MRFVDVDGVFVNPRLVTTIHTDADVTKVSFGRWAIDVALPLAEVVDLLEEDDES